VAQYLEAEGIEIQDAISLEVDDNLAVGRLDPRDLPEIAGKLDTRDVDVVVLSACVQMPSLPGDPRHRDEARPAGCHCGHRHVLDGVEQPRLGSRRRWRRSALPFLVTAGSNSIVNGA